MSNPRANRYIRVQAMCLLDTLSQLSLHFLMSQAFHDLREQLIGTSNIQSEERKKAKLPQSPLVWTSLSDHVANHLSLSHYHTVISIENDGTIQAIAPVHHSQFLNSKYSLTPIWEFQSLSIGSQSAEVLAIVSVDSSIVYYHTLLASAIKLDKSKRRIN